MNFTGRERPARSAVELETLANIPGWRDRSASAEVRFLGRGADRGRGANLPAAWVGEERLVAHMHQVNSLIRTW